MRAGPSLATTSNHNEIGGHLVGKIDNAISWAPLLKPDVYRLPQALQDVLLKSFEIRLRFLSGDFPSQRVVRLRCAIFVLGLHDVRERHGAPERFCKRDRMGYAHFREGRAVQTDQDPTSGMLRLDRTREADSIHRGRRGACAGLRARSQI
jgi:hypothetical protein